MATRCDARSLLLWPGAVWPVTLVNAALCAIACKWLPAAVSAHPDALAVPSRVLQEILDPSIDKAMLEEERKWAPLSRRTSLLLAAAPLFL